MDGPGLSANYVPDPTSDSHLGQLGHQGHLAMSEDIFDFHHLGVPTGISRGEAREADPMVHKATPTPQQRIICPKVSVASRLRNLLICLRLSEGS